MPATQHMGHGVQSVVPLPVWPDREERSGTSETRYSVGEARGHRGHTGWCHVGGVSFSDLKTGRRSSAQESSRCPTTSCHIVRHTNGRTRVGSKRGCDREYGEGKRGPPRKDGNAHPLLGREGVPGRTLDVERGPVE